MTSWHISGNLFFSQGILFSNFEKFNLFKCSQSCTHYTCFLRLQKLPVNKCQEQQWKINTHPTSCMGWEGLWRGGKEKRATGTSIPHAHSPPPWQHYWIWSEILPAAHELRKQTTPRMEVLFTFLSIFKNNTTRTSNPAGHPRWLHHSFEWWGSRIGSRESPS